MRKIREVIRLHQSCEASARRIALSVGIARSSVGEYLHRADAARLVWPLPEDLTDEALERLLFPPQRKPGEAPRPMPDWAYVQKELCRKGVTLLLLWREYKERFPDGYGYSRYADLYAAWEKKTDLRMLQRHKAGEKLFVDFVGLTAPLTDPLSGEVRQVQVFAGALGASQRVFAKAYQAQTLENWLGANADALEFYGGVPEILVPDNLKAGVTSVDRYEPVLNPAFSEFAHHYGLSVVPARPRKPRDKAKVENAVQQVERWVLAPLRKATFFGLEELNAAIAGKVEELNARLMKGPNASRDELFEELDRPALRALPSERYRFANWKRAKVAPDYHVEYEGHRYSTPHGLAGKQVDLRVSLETVEIFLGGKRIFTHARSAFRRGFTTEPAHMPRSHREFAEWTPERLERWASQTGPAAAGFVRELMNGRVHPQQGFRSCMGVISLSKSYGPERLEAACARALAFKALSYRSVKTILEKGLDAQPLLDPRPSPPPGTHSNVRGASYYKEEAPCAN